MGTEIKSLGSKDQQEARKRLIELYEQCPMPTEEFLTNPGLYIRSSVLAKFLYIDELYRRILGTPGIIMEFGVWWGQNLSLFESLRAIHEPYNYRRKIVGFDTFQGYPNGSNEDGSTYHSLTSGYNLPIKYVEYLSSILDYHEKENTMPHIKKYELIEGDVTQTIDEYLELHPETIISLAYFDLGLYEPTRKCLQSIKPFFTKGTVIAMDELNSADLPGETIAFKEVLGLQEYEMISSQYLPDRSIITNIS